MQASISRGVGSEQDQLRHYKVKNKFTLNNYKKRTTQNDKLQSHSVHIVRDLVKKSGKHLIQEPKPQF